MKRSSPHAFTLVEMLMVMVIIAIISGLIVGVAGLANSKALKNRAFSEIKGLESACERYKSDNGSYPRSAGETEPSGSSSGAYPDPRLAGDAGSDKYKKASLYLYQQLSGDIDEDGRPSDVVAGTATPSYFEFKPGHLGGITSANPVGTAKAVKYLADPYGFSYGYCTVGAFDEEDYRQRASTDKTASRVSGRGFSTSFDIWTTCNTTVDPPTDASRMKWAKNW